MRNIKILCQSDAHCGLDVFLGIFNDDEKLNQARLKYIAQNEPHWGGYGGIEGYVIVYDDIDIRSSGEWGDSAFFVFTKRGVPKSKEFRYITNTKEQADAVIAEIKNEKKPDPAGINILKFNKILSESKRFRLAIVEDRKSIIRRCLVDYFKQTEEEARRLIAEMMESLRSCLSIGKTVHDSIWWHVEPFEEASNLLGLSREEYEKMTDLYWKDYVERLLGVED